MTSTAPGHVTTPNMFPDYRPRNEFSIPIFPHLKKYLKKQFGLKGVTTVTELTIVGKTIMLALRDNRSESEYNDQYRDKIQFTQNITVQLSADMMRLGPRLGKLMRINIYLDMIFKESLITWIFAQQAAGIPPYTACQTFLKYYSIEEKEYSLDAAYKYWQRHTP